jgi:hypothetical protein
MKKGLLGILVAILLTSGVWIYQWWHQPASTASVSTSQQTQSDVLGSETKLQSWRTAYFMTSFPVSYRLLSSDEVSQGLTTGQYVLSSISFKQTDQVAVTVGRLGNLSLQELPVLKVRLLKSDLYQPVSPSYLPSGGLAFASANPYETSLFWRQGDQYAAVVISGSSSRQPELEQALETVVTNWQWR